MKGPLVQAKLTLAVGKLETVLSADDGIQRLLGFSAEDLLGSKVKLRDRIHHDDADIAASLFAPVTQTESGTFNIRLRHADGCIRCITGRFTKRPALGRVGHPSNWCCRMPRACLCNSVSLPV